MGTVSRKACKQRNEQWTELLKVVLPSCGGKFVAYGDTCAAAVHYGDFFDSMTACELAALRVDFDERLHAIKRVADMQGLSFEVPSGFESLDGAPHARVGKGGQWIYLYPLDNLPMQITLRFKIFREAAAAQRSGYRRCGHVLRYNKFNLPICSRLFSGDSPRGMGERTVFQRTVYKKNLFPARVMRLGAIEVPVPKVTGSWTLEMTEERAEAIRTIQQESLASLGDIDRACSEMGIDYFLVGGSMLGAVRHHGFIPWDDDTDVGLLRRDYKRFCKKCKRYLSDKYFLQLPRTDPHIHFVYARLRRAGYDYITYYNEDKDFNKGIWVDLFPFDARPKNESLAKIQNRCANVFARASMGLKRRREYVEHDVQLDAPVACSEDRRYLRGYRIKSRFFPVALCRLGYNISARFFNPFLARSKHALFASFIPSYTTISAEEVHPLRRVEYSGVKLNIPCGAEAFLMRQYGDYESLPEIHERYSEHGFKCLRKQFRGC